MVAWDGERGRVVGGCGWLFVAKGGVRVLGLSFLFFFFVSINDMLQKVIR